jgi:hypothetical protein
MCRIAHILYTSLQVGRASDLRAPPHPPPRTSPVVGGKGWWDEGLETGVLLLVWLIGRRGGICGEVSTAEAVGSLVFCGRSRSSSSGKSSFHGFSCTTSSLSTPPSPSPRALASSPSPAMAPLVPRPSPPRCDRPLRVSSNVPSRLAGSRTSTSSAGDEGSLSR